MRVPSPGALETLAFSCVEERYRCSSCSFLPCKRRANLLTFVTRRTCYVVDRSARTCAYLHSGYDLGVGHFDEVVDLSLRGRPLDSTVVGPCWGRGTWVRCIGLKGDFGAVVRNLPNR